MAVNVVERIDDGVKIRNVLASVSDKAGLERMVPALIRINPDVTIYSTGGTHAAAVGSADGEILCVFEDIGRHNAVDKAVGFLLENGLLARADILAVSGRVSFEIVQKCARAGIPVLTAVSAPSSLAVETAERWNITLAGFCREDRATYYSGLGRVDRGKQNSHG